LLQVIQKSIQTLFYLKKLYQMLFEHTKDDRWKKRLGGFVKQKQRHLEILQYMHLLASGKYYNYEPASMQHHSKGDLVYVTLENEVMNIRWHYELFTYVLGTRKHVLKQSLHQSLECAKVLVEMIDDSMVRHIHLSDT